MRIKIACKKIFITVSILLLWSSCSSAALVGNTSPIPGGTPMPTVPNNPTVPSQPNIQGGGGGMNLSGLEGTTSIRTENVDLRPSTSLTDSTQNQNANIRTNMREYSSEGPSDKEINEYFNQILFARTEGNPMRELIEELPRFGMSFFGGSSYAPEETAPITQGYILSVGDELTITLWGIPEEGNYQVAIDRDGMAVIPHVGTIRLAGYTMIGAERMIRTRLNQYYTGYQMNLSLGKLSSITVYLTGNARRPGAYTVSSFATLINALLVSGGPSTTGSLRKIELKRDGKTITVLDMYAMLLRGDKTNDVRLQAGDVIYIPPVGPLVGVAGEIQKPGVYELNGTTRVKDLLYIAGGLNAQTFRGRVQFYRVYENAYAGAFEGSFDEIENNILEDGDIIRLFPIYNFAASATVNGALMVPGTYVIVPGHTRVSEIVQRAGGLAITASDIAELTRVTPTLEGPVNERFRINLVRAIQGDPMDNMTLQNGDMLTVLVIPEWKQQIQVSITGEVRRPGVYSMFQGERLSDLIEKAGGFTSKAFLKGAIFTRKTIAEEQMESLVLMVDRMQRELLESMQNTASGSTGTANSIGALNSEYERRRELINNLRQLDIMGRIVTKIDTPKNIIGTPWDYELQDGDMLDIPDTPLTVNVMGAVYSSSTMLYRPNMSITGYINAAGGALKTAHKRMVYLLKNDGTTIKVTRSTAMLTSKQWSAPRGFSAKVEPGDTIVVPVKYLDRQPVESFKDAIDIIYKVAVAAGVIIDVTND